MYKYGIRSEDNNWLRAQGAVTVTAGQRVGRVVDISWAPLPQPAGAGLVLCAALDDGSLAFVDTGHSSVGGGSRRQRLGAFKHLLGGSWPFPQGVLSAPPPLGSSLLLPAPWAHLLALLLQQVRPSKPVVLC